MGAQIWGQAWVVRSFFDPVPNPLGWRLLLP